MRRLIVVLILAFAGRLLAQSSDTLLAPLPIRDQFLLSNGFLFFEPEQARVLDENESQFSLIAADSNTFAKSAWINRSLTGHKERASVQAELSDSRFHLGDPIFLVDGETHRVELQMYRGFGHNLELGVSVPITSIGGGWSDAAIEVVHHALSIGNANREALRRNSEAVYFRSETTQYVRNRSSGYVIGDIGLSAKYELAPLEDKKLSLAICGDVELPTGNAKTLDGSGSLDAGLQVVASRDFSVVRVHAALGALRLGANRPLGTRSQVLITDTLAVSRMMTDRTAMIAQLTISESPFRGLGFFELDRRSYQLSVGARRQIGQSADAYVAIVENILNYDNSADAGVIWGIARRF